MTFLADQFEKLANDPSWPWQFKKSGVITNTQGSPLTITANMLGGGLGPLIASFPLTMARLALMVVEKERRFQDLSWGGKGGLDSIARAILQLDINPDHYANVKKRVADEKAP